MASILTKKKNNQIVQKTNEKKRFEENSAKGIEMKSCAWAIFLLAKRMNQLKLTTLRHAITKMQT